MLSFYDDSVKVFKDDSSLSVLGSARSNSLMSSIDFQKDDLNKRSGSVLKP